MLIAAAVIGLSLLTAEFQDTAQTTPAIKPLSPAKREARRAKMLDQLKITAAKRAEELLAPGAVADVRDMTNTAFAVLAAGADPKLAEKLLDHAYSLQDMDPSSPTYGYIPWREGDTDIRRDPNSIEFATQSMGPILLSYSDLLSTSFKEKLKPHITAAFSALRLHHPPIWYTNIYLMNTVNMILMGEAVKDMKAAADGYAQLDKWIEYTSEAGIHEYDSPVYYGVDLESLRLGYLLAAQPERKAKFKAILDLYWSDMCVNFFSANKRLAGPQSRNYDFLGGTGLLTPNFWIEGLIDGDFPGGSAYLYFTSGEDGYHPDSKILSLSAIPERIIRSRWDTKPGGDRYCYMTPDFTIGCSSMYYEPQDRPIAIELASSKPNFPIITLQADHFDAPYGKARIIDGCGHSKPFHWPLNPLAIQEKGFMLVMLDLDPSKINPPSSTFATNIILPAKADEITLDGKPIATDKPFELSATIESIVGVHEGNSGVAMRIFSTENCLHSEPVLKLQAEEQGLESGALRFTAYHHNGGAQKLSNTHILVGILFLADHCETESDFANLLTRMKNVTIEEHRDKGAWQVRVKEGDTTLEAGRAIDTRSILYRRVNGSPWETELLKVNETDLAGPILRGL